MLSESCGSIIILPLFIFNVSAMIILAYSMHELAIVHGATYMCGPGQLSKSVHHLKIRQPDCCCFSAQTLADFICVAK